MVAQLHGADALGLATPELAYHDHDDLTPLGNVSAIAVLTPTSKEKVPDTSKVKGLGQTEKQCLLYEQPANYGPVCLGITRGSVARELRDLAIVAGFRDQTGGAHA